jgi:uncharacterized protein
MIFFLRLFTCTAALLLLRKANAREASDCGSLEFNQGALSNKTIVELSASTLQWDWHKDPSFAPYLTDDVTAKMEWCIYTNFNGKVQAMQICDTVSDSCTSLALYNDMECSEPTLCDDSNSTAFEISCTGLSNEFPNCKVECGLYSQTDGCGLTAAPSDPAPIGDPTPASSASSFASTNALLMMIGCLYLMLSLLSVTHSFVLFPQPPQQYHRHHYQHQYPSPTSHRTTFRCANIVDEVSEQMKIAMKAKDTTKLATIRLARAAFANAAIELKVKALNDEQAIDVLRKMSKMRTESIDMYTKVGAMDRAQAEQAELEVLNQWLPSLADEDQTRQWVLEAIQQQSGDTVNIGKVMGALMKAHKGELDGSLAQKVVKEEVAKL